MERTWQSGGAQLGTGHTHLVGYSLLVNALPLLNGSPLPHVSLHQLLGEALPHAGARLALPCSCH